jgi:hypothetical protein
MLYICKLSNKLDLNQAIHASHTEYSKLEGSSLAIAYKLVLLLGPRSKGRLLALL